MSVQPQIGDLLNVWTTLTKSDTAMSVIRSYRVTLASGVSLPNWETLSTKLAVFHWNRFSPLMASGEYKILLVAHIERDESPLESIQAEIPGWISPNNEEGLPPNVAPMSLFRATLPRPREVSRLYWPFPKRSLLGNDTELSVGGIAEVQTQANQFLGSLDWGGSGFSIRVRSIIRHRRDNTFDTIATADTSTLFATQRRRARGKQKLYWRA